MTQPNIIVSLRRKGSEKNLGSAVAVAPHKLLTAKHVVMPDGEKISETDIEATLLSFRGSLSVKRIDHHPERDISLITLAHEHQKTVVSCNLAPALKENLWVNLLACNTAENCVKGPFEVQLTNWTEPGGWEFHTTPAHGMSGGAVLLDDKLVGIIQARDNAEGSGIMIPLIEIKEFLLEHLIFDSVTQNTTEFPQSFPIVDEKSKLPKKHDNDFVTKVKKEMQKLLDNDSLEVFKDVLFKELNDVLSDLHQERISNKSALDLVNGLLLALEKGGEDVPVIMNALLLATVSCLDRKHDRNIYKAAGENRELIRDVAEELLGWLVVMSIVQDSCSKILPELNHLPAIYFELPVMTEWGVEVLVSRKFQRPVKLKLRGSDILGEHLFAFNWKKDTVVSQLKLELWNTVFPDRDKKVWDNNLQSDLLELNASLSAQRNNRYAPKHHYLAARVSDEFEDAYKAVCEQLLKELNELTVIRFGDPTDLQVFCTYEHSLMAKIREFLTTIKSIN
jgi:hypothetical protein